MDDLICLLLYFSLWIWLEIRAIGVEAVVWIAVKELVE